ncbi:MAG: alpha/beta hydrolase [Chloroflexi bacterium]|nr:alpha/beta hydrolase [Chloroflexota bacterium]
MPSISVNNCQLHYTRNSVAAQRPALVFVHGAGGSGQDWPYQWQQTSVALSRGEPRWITDYPLYFLDLPGHGRSQPLARRTIEEYAAGVAAFIEALGMRQAVIVGHSMGGAIALTLGLLQPANLAGLVILGSGPSMPVSDVILDGLAANFAQTVGLIMKFSWRKEARPIYREVATQHMLAAGSEVVHGDFAACNAFNVQARLGEISAPTLVVGSTTDRMMPLAQSEKLAAAIPGAQLAVIEDGGHFMMMERTNEVSAALLAFLKMIQAQ